MTLDITCFDAFCGAGGSSTGIRNAGVHVKHAVNHWDRAIETHSLNHPTTDHDIMDLQKSHPSMFPRTTICWMSPECTQHSKAKGRVRKNISQMSFLDDDDRYDPEEERSRATMREVVEFSEYHKYEIVIVENVVEIRYWEYYDEWLLAMKNLGYEHKLLYLNAMFFGVPQSRDRIYCVFWKKGNKAPDLEFNPYAFCIDHGVVATKQAWKRNRVAGKYGHHGQYIYVCPECSRPLEPFTLPAADVIDWGLPVQRIGDRGKPLKDKTMKRIKEGLRRFAQPVTPFIVDTVFPIERTKVRATEDPLYTVTTQQTLAVCDPFLLSYMNQALAADAIIDPLRTVATGFTPRMVVPPSFLLHYYGRENASSDTRDPFPVVTPENRFSLVVGKDYETAARYLSFISEMRGQSIGRRVTEPLGAVTTTGSHHALINVTPDAFVIADYGHNPVYTRADEPLSTINTTLRHGLVITDEMVADCGFRMLEPKELKLAMSFPGEYVITGTKREQTKQIGDAVCCNVAQAIVERCVASLN